VCDRRRGREPARGDDATPLAPRSAKTAAHTCAWDAHSDALALVFSAQTVLLVPDDAPRVHAP
jgi:hypothetical protein